ncbi:hypothetical protein JXR93_14410 [bacterium]|nr:hypothetical protein [bacterium]
MKTTLYISHFYNFTTIYLEIGDKIYKRDSNERGVSKVFYQILDDIFKESESSFEKINEMIFINGPGSFTSLRFFLTFVKALSVSIPNILFIPLNLLDVIGFSQKGENSVIMGGTKRFIEHFYYAKYYKDDSQFKLIEPHKIISYELASKIDSPLFIGIEPDFKIVKKDLSIENMRALADWKKSTNSIDSIISLEPYYIKAL